SRFVLNADAVRFRVLERHLRGDATIAWSAARGSVDPNTLFANPADTALRILGHAPSAAVNEPATFTIEARGSRREVAWGTVDVNFGDGTVVEHSSMLG